MSTFQTAVVTGASRGFGRAIAAALVAEGARVVGIARGEHELRVARDELGEGFVPVAADAAFNDPGLVPTFAVTPSRPRAGSARG